MLLCCCNLDFQLESPIKGKSSMGKKKDLSAAEKCKIVESLGQGMKTLDIL